MASLKIKQHQNHLNEIALRPNTIGEIDYLDEAEKQEKKQGYQDRINAYAKLREQAHYF